MIKKIKKTHNFLSTLLLITIVLYLTVGTVFIIRENIDYLQFSTYLSYFGIASIVLYLLYKLINLEGIKFKDIIVILLGIIGVISYKNALDPEMALIGTPGRNEGLKVILTYYSIFLLSSTIPRKNQRIILFFVLLTGIFQVILGTVQTLGITNIFSYSRIGNFSTNFNVASGTFGNPNLYSTYMLLCLLYSFGLLLKDDKVIKSIGHTLLSIFFVYGLIIGDTSGCIIAAGIVIVVSLAKKINKDNIKKVLIGTSLLAIGAFLCLTILDKQINYRLSRTIDRNVNEIKDILQEGIKDSTGNYRIYIWKSTLKKVPKYLYHGIGIDNFSYINNGTYFCVGEEKNKQCFDKAHNEYLQILITEGIFALITYLSLILYTIGKYFKEKKYFDKVSYALFLAFIGYLIQAQLNISVITVAPIFYSIMGFLHYNNDKKKKSSISRFIDSNIDKRTLFIIIIIFILMTLKGLISFKFLPAL